MNAEDRDELLEKMQPEIEKYFDKQLKEFEPKDPSIPLASSTYGTSEVMEALESMLSTYLTVGEKVGDFEEKWADYIGSKEGLMFSSGSSANLAALKALSQDFEEDAEVIVPAVGWSTNVFPIMDTGAKPVFVDVRAEELVMDIEAIKEAVNEDTEAIMVVHLLGNPAPMDEIVQISKEHDLKVIEDCAEAHGAEYKGEKVGSIGDIGTFSFSFSHHVTTGGEGGIAVTDSPEYQKRMGVLRSWGKSNEGERPDGSSSEGKELDVEFISHGYNLRPTEVQAAFGIHQTEKMDDIVQRRRKNAFRMNESLKDVDEINVLEERRGVKCSYLHYPLVVDSESDYDSDELREHLENNGIETRPMLSGNMARHPAFKKSCKVSGELEGAEKLHFKGLYVSCHSYLRDRHRKHIVEKVKEFFES
jgi:CDP-6-deoxy-D-xylo-4-hexulose-3-dehydrase